MPLNYRALPNLVLPDQFEFEKSMGKKKQECANFHVQHISMEEMFTAERFMDLKTAYKAYSMGKAFVNAESLMALIAVMQIYPKDELLQELLETGV